MSTDVVTIGEAMIAFRSQGQLSLSAPMSASLAGAETNVAIGLSRLGHASAWIGALGVDPAGELAVRTLRAEGVDVRNVRRDPSRPTGVMLVDMPATLPPVVTYHRRGSAGSHISTSDIIAAPRSARIWHLTGVTPALSSEAHAAIQAAIDTARTCGALVSFDVNYRAKLWSRDSAAEILAPLAHQADIVIASEDELELVADGVDEKSRVAALLAGVPSEVIIKRGSRGADQMSLNGTVSCPAFAVTEVNSIGAGDAFTAGYLSGFLDGAPIHERLTRGAMCGALAVSGIGDWEQAPTRAQLETLGSPREEASR